MKAKAKRTIKNLLIEFLRTMYFFAITFLLLYYAPLILVMEPEQQLLENLTKALYTRDLGKDILNIHNFLHTHFEDFYSTSHKCRGGLRYYCIFKHRYNTNKSFIDALEYTFRAFIWDVNNIFYRSLYLAYYSKLATCGVYSSFAYELLGRMGYNVTKIKAYRDHSFLKIKVGDFTIFYDPSIRDINKALILTSKEREIHAKQYQLTNVLEEKGNEKITILDKYVPITNFIIQTRVPIDVQIYDCSHNDSYKEIIIYETQIGKKADSILPTELNIKFSKYGCYRVLIRCSDIKIMDRYFSNLSSFQDIKVRINGCFSEPALSFS